MVHSNLKFLQEKLITDCKPSISLGEKNNEGQRKEYRLTTFWGLNLDILSHIIDIVENLIENIKKELPKLE